MELRSKNLIIQTFFGFFLKGLLFIISYLQVPFLANILNDDELGLWFTFLSFYNWFILFDFGIGHGLKNLLIERFSNDDMVGVRSLISSAFYLTLILILFLILFFCSLSKIANIGLVFKSHLNVVFINDSLVFIFATCLILFFNNSFNAIVNSCQKSSYSNVLNVLVNILLISAICVLSNLNYSNDNVLVYLSKWNFMFYVFGSILTIFLFFLFNSKLTPNFLVFDATVVKEIIKKGILFFIIQLSILFVFPIDSFLISNMISAEESARYNLIIKLFSYTIVAVSILVQTFWPAFTEAFFNKEFKWIKSYFRKLNIIGAVIFLTMIPIVFYVNDIVKLWTRKSFSFQYYTIELISVLVLHFFYILSLNYSVLLYATNKLKSQVKIGFVLIALKLIFIIVFFWFDLRSISVIMFSSAFLFFMLFLCNYYLSNKMLQNLKRIDNA